MIIGFFGCRQLIFPNPSAFHFPALIQGIPTTCSASFIGNRLPTTMTKIGFVCALA
jgi:hypothetical protein